MKGVSDDREATSPCASDASSGGESLGTLQSVEAPGSEVKRCISAAAAPRSGSSCFVAGAGSECEASSSCFAPARLCWRLCWSAPGGGVAEQTDSAGLDSSARGPSIVFCSFARLCLESFSGEEDLTESSGGYPLSTNSSGGHPLFILDDVQLIWRLPLCGQSGGRSRVNPR
ncbi:hypothetical protein T484DRAFT_1972830 [Baffinella frigidus]|nr:hypothetical protein T484DRAFT_1972830 [Cryptophyta sp. CCMP2293]